jgi:hypothetical protein
MANPFGREQWRYAADGQVSGGVPKHPDAEQSKTSNAQTGKDKPAYTVFSKDGDAATEVKPASVQTDVWYPHEPKAEEAMAQYVIDVVFNADGTLKIGADIFPQLTSVKPVQVCGEWKEQSGRTIITHEYPIGYRYDLPLSIPVPRFIGTEQVPAILSLQVNFYPFIAQNALRLEYDIYVIDKGHKQRYFGDRETLEYVFENQLGTEKVPHRHWSLTKDAAYLETGVQQFLGRIQSSWEQQVALLPAKIKETRRRIRQSYN